jgi:hypothetical protein
VGVFGAGFGCVYATLHFERLAAYGAADGT